MSEHVSQWIGAYHDQELSGSRLRQVEAHLEDCPTCRAELETLRSLSIVLKEDHPTETISSPDRFAAEVLLRLPRHQVRTRPRKALEFGWWLVPVGAIGAWLFLQTTLLVSWLASSSAQLGILGEETNWVTRSSSLNLWTSSLASLFNGNLSQAGQATLQAFRWVETLGRGLWSTLGWQVLIGLPYLAWLILWWRRRNQKIVPNTE